MDNNRRRMVPATTLELADGRCIEYRIEVSARRRSVGLRLSARDGLVVSVPRGFDPTRLEAIVRAKAAWVARHLARFDAVRRHRAAPAVRPPTVALPGVGELWRVEYRPTLARSVAAGIPQPGLVRLSGSVSDVATCHAALRRWLAHRARQTLVPWVERLSHDTGLLCSGVRIRGQRTRWGSCSAAGAINLNYKLLLLPRSWARYVLLHELCHTRELNHSPRFWALVHRWEPEAREIHRQMREAWRLLPAWVEPV
jgi:predicted metal-dependent hydrolase